MSIVEDISDGKLDARRYSGVLEPKGKLGVHHDCAMGKGKGLQHTWLDQPRIFPLPHKFLFALILKDGRPKVEVSILPHCFQCDAHGALVVSQFHDPVQSTTASRFECSNLLPTVIKCPN